MRESFTRSPPLTLPLFGDNNVRVVATSRRREKTTDCGNDSIYLKEKQQKRKMEGYKFDPLQITTVSPSIYLVLQEAKRKMCRQHMYENRTISNLFTDCFTLEKD